MDFKVYRKDGRKKMKIIFLLITLQFCFSTSFSTEWSKNNIFKLSFYKLTNYDFFSDYEDIVIENFSLKAKNLGGWLYTKPIEIKQNIMVKNAFINLKNSTMGIKFRVIDYNTDEIIGEKILTNSGIISLKDNFRKNLYLSIEFLDTTTEILSIGLKGKILILLPEDNLIVEPLLVFYNEEKLTIKFKLGKPAYVDILLFNKRLLADKIIKDTLLKNGEVVINYDISQLEKKYLSTGKHWIYIKATDIENNKTEEVSTSFYFVKD